MTLMAVPQQAKRRYAFEGPGQPVKLTGLLKMGLFFAAVSALVAVGGVDDLIQGSQRNVSEGIAFCAFSLLGFYVAGSMVWTYRRLRQGHP